MILPGKLNLKGRIGTTFDVKIVVYPSEYARLKWLCGQELFWSSTATYLVEQVIVGTDGKAYVSKIESTEINPVGDVSGHWEKLTPYNLTGCTVEMKIAEELIVLTIGSGITVEGAGGTISAEATPEQTATIPGPSKTAFSLTVKEAGGKLYEYVEGDIAWKAQQ